ncbi:MULTISPECIES: HK97-gp10 family putative phage morphogenesis protein [Protofrankia]|uniref:Phage protein, HK97 gp10 family n=1 Tax=Protofrankia coriariae TaxID=1562887 RepID=A0ABR5F4C4_9ACTN|nr:MULTISPECIES: HK97-gp10 family putative phage morphogenesis protein [Protofrankia]KLL11582.1 hypothetical protein FrCorBMG51_11145 [Protofrankia coriariae]ONH35718.1 hypothetical protein BL254_10540 [Protofrankia sp. BMG5.30]
MASSDRSTVRIEGLDRLARRLADLGNEVNEAVRRAVRTTAEEVRRDTQAQVRVDTGGLLHNVDIEYEQDGLVAEVGWLGDRTPYYYAAFHEEGTAKIRKRPALRPAAEAAREVLKEQLRVEIRRELR